MVAGADRYATAADIALTFSSVGPATVLVATGLDFPDALAGAPLGGGLWSPIVLVPGTSVPSTTAEALGLLRSPEIDVLGGTGVVSAGVMTALGGHIAP